jgi:hypothetical protein
MVSTRRVIAVLALTAAAVAAVIGSSAPAQNPTTRTLTFKELEKGSTFTHVRNTKTRSRRANSQGDVIAFANPVADPSGRRIGTLDAACTTTKGSPNFLKSTVTCQAILVLHDGSLAIQANNTPGVSTTTGAVTGGTGAYANARGVYVSKDGSDSTITLAG